MGFRKGCALLLLLAIYVMDATGFVGGLPSIPGASLVNPMNAVENLQALAGSAPIAPGKCSIAGTSATCCANVGMSKFNLNSDVCLKLGFQLSSMKIDASLIVNGETLFTNDLSKGLVNMCHPVPKTMQFLRACLDIYHMDFQPTSLSAEICAAVNISRVVRIQFDCVKFDKGMISIHSDRTPDSFSLVNIAVNRGSPTISLGRPSLTSIGQSLPLISSFFPKAEEEKPSSSLSSLIPSVPQLPSLSSVVPSVPQLPSLPSVPSVPQLPSLSSVVPSTPQLPSLSSVVPKPSLPSLSSQAPKPESQPSGPAAEASNAAAPSVTSTLSKLPGMSMFG